MPICWSDENVFVLNLGHFNVQIQSERGAQIQASDVILKLKTYLIFISRVVVHSVCLY